jgi:hypothetical protein
VEAILELRYMLRMMGIKIEPTSNLLCDNQSVVINMQFPSSNLKKKHNAVAYHRCREAVAAGIVRVGHVRSEDNLADIMTKPKGPADYYRHLRPPLYGKYPTSAPVRGSCRNDRLKPSPSSLGSVTGDSLDHSGTPRTYRKDQVTPSDTQINLSGTSDTKCDLEHELDVNESHLYLGDSLVHDLDSE